MDILDAYIIKLKFAKTYVSATEEKRGAILYHHLPGAVQIGPAFSTEYATWSDVFLPRNFF